MFNSGGRGRDRIGVGERRRRLGVRFGVGGRREGVDVERDRRGVQRDGFPGDVSGPEVCDHGLDGGLEGAAGQAEER